MFIAFSKAVEIFKWFNRASFASQMPDVKPPGFDTRDPIYLMACDDA